jgi:WD40 repeat protein
MTWDSKDIAVMDESGTAQAFKLSSGKSLSPLVHLKGYEANQIAISNGGNFIALGGPSPIDGGPSRIGVFESSTGRLRFSPDVSGDVQSIDLTPDGRYLAAATGSEVRVFDIERRAEVWKKSDFNESISTIAFSADGRQLAVGGPVGGQMGELNVFRTETPNRPLSLSFQWRPEQDCRNPDAPCKLNAIVFSRDGKYVVLSGNDRMVRVVDLKLAKQIAVFTLPGNVVYAILSNDDRFVATSSEDLKGRVYEIATLKELWRMPIATGNFFPVAFTSDDKYLLSATYSREMIVERHAWRSEDIINSACAAVGRNLRQDEWNKFLGEPLPRSCPGFL